MQEKRKILTENNLESAKRSAMDLIQRRKYTVYEVTQKLIKKGFSEEWAQKAAAYYEELGYLDDARYAMLYIKDALRLRGYGYRRIAEDLARRGVRRDLIDQTYADLDPDPVERLVPMLEKFAYPQSPQEEQKLYAYFLRRGFTYHEVSEAQRRLQEQ